MQSKLSELVKLLLEELESPTTRLSTDAETYVKSIRDLLLSEEDRYQVVYAVKWVEVEFGERDEGYKLFLDKDKCINSTKKSSKNGAYTGGGGYLGPARPLCYVEIPFFSLEQEIKENLKAQGAYLTPRRWNPQFRGKVEFIK